jgi:FKBP-type peptidyl-prolyl cis-trans isomerase
MPSPTQVIAGWNAVLKTMEKGELARVVIAPEKGKSSAMC